MEARQRRNVSLVSSGILAVLTLSVFMASLNKGPVSSVTRFHQALARDDRATLRAVSLGPLDSPSMLALRQQILNRIGPQTKIEVARVDRKKGYAFVYVVYRSQNSQAVPWVFATKRFESTWLVDAEYTLIVNTRLPGE